MARVDSRSFESASSHGYFRVAAATPHVALARAQDNGRATAALATAAAARGARLVVFPELGLSGYANEDLFFQDALLDAVECAVADLCTATAGLDAALVVGAPLRLGDALYNCAVLIAGGAVQGVVPKVYLPNYREFYEKRYFAPAQRADRARMTLAGADVPFGADLIFDVVGIAGLSLHIEVCEDLWVPVPPSALAALAGATLLTNLSASNVTVGKAGYRRALAAGQSGRCIAGYVYCAAGFGESTTDLAWDGQAMIHENGELLVESARFCRESSLIVADIDIDRLRQERARTTSFGDCAAIHADRTAAFRRIPLALARVATAGPLLRPLSRFPFVPADAPALAERCAEAQAIQVQGLAQRLDATGIKRVVIGVSGGADSALALIVAAKAFDFLGYPRRDILAYAMPGFATSRTTRDAARALMAALGVGAEEIDIRPAAMQTLRDIGHPYAAGEPCYDVTFENVQAGARTACLFRLANRHAGLVVGTGDLSELALGYTTYGVGDQMSHYAVNASVPKTLVRHLLAWCIDDGGLGGPAGAALRAVLDTGASPELVPADAAHGLQDAEATVGPYALQDFFLYYISRYGYRPSKVAYLALQAWGDAESGDWPVTVPRDQRVAYDLPTIKHWLAVFLRRFFETSQFKRSALPNGPKIGSGGSLSPRSDWRAPSDARADVWLAELEANVP